jgi:hypothetical protein
MQVRTPDGDQVVDALDVRLSEADALAGQHR